MYDMGKVVAGIVVFVGFMTTPLWWQVLGNNEPLQLAEPTGEACVESAEYMRAKHMDLLADWRKSVVRKGLRQYVSTDGTPYEMSLTSTCLDCHADKVGFCDECHDYTGVDPGCWECHVDPEEVN